jgi:hypothetical protein
MHPRGQGAMEYLMTYGWAILVVMMVGAAMWRLGVFDIGSSVPATSSGFQILKPLLPTCKMGERLWGSSWDYNGFNCQMVNNAGGEIRIKDVNCTIDGRYGQWCFVQTDKETGGGTYSYFGRSCTNEACSTTSLFTAGSKIKNGRLVVKSGESVIILLLSSSSAWPYTFTLTKGKAYQIDVVLDYETDVGGVTVTKRERGQIMVSR